MSRELPFIDVHSHIVFGVDDGSKDLAMSLEMLRRLKSEGAGTVFATPHFYEGERNSSHIKERFEILKGEAQKEKIDIELFLGNEIFCASDPVRAVRDGEAFTYDGGRHVLIEFSPANSMDAIRCHTEDFLREGYVPVIAHAERYNALFGKIQNMYEIVSLGAHIQINCDTIAGAGFLRKNYLKKLMREGLIFAVGTDCHNLTSRPPKMRDAYLKTAALAGEAEAEKIFCLNARELIK